MKRTGKPLPPPHPSECYLGEETPRESMAEECVTVTFIWSKGSGVQTGKAAETAWEVRVGSGARPGESNEPTCLLEPVGALAGLPLTKKSLNLRHPLCLALAVPDGAENAEANEKQEAQATARQYRGQEHR